jgi:hypothetical protein
MRWLAPIFVTMLCAGSIPASGLEDGYRAMYNLKFDEAHRIFEDWQRRHPEDPFAAASGAAAYLFSEFDRLRILQAEFFLEDRGFAKSAVKLTPDPLLKARFEIALNRADQLATAALAKSNRDTNALFAKAMLHGLRADYLGLIEKRYLPSLSAMKLGRTYAELLLSIDPSFGDAYLSSGVENYVLSQKPMPVRWMLRAYGSEADAARAMQMIQLCLEKGRYMKPFARLLLAVAAVRDKQYDRAREILYGLAREFPSNPLYAQQAEKLPK